MNIKVVCPDFKTFPIGQIFKSNGFVWIKTKTYLNEFGNTCDSICLNDGGFGCDDNSPSDYELATEIIVKFGV